MADWEGDMIRDVKGRFVKGGPVWEKHPQWKGDDVGYGQLHTWVRRTLGQPSKCDNCGTTSAKMFDWANKSGEYKRLASDWMRLCRKCHVRYDRVGSISIDGFCAAGHEMSASNIYTRVDYRPSTPNVYEECRVCRDEARHKNRLKRKVSR